MFSSSSFLFMFQGVPLHVLHLYFILVSVLSSHVEVALYLCFSGITSCGAVPLYVCFTSCGAVPLYVCFSVIT
jgi:hypothetical protein